MSARERESEDTTIKHTLVQGGASVFTVQHSHSLPSLNFLLPSLFHSLPLLFSLPTLSFASLSPFSLPFALLLSLFHTPLPK